MDIPAYIREAKEIWNRISVVPFSEINEDQWNELYYLYSRLYPNSKGTPSKEELIDIIRSAANYKG